MSGLKFFISLPLIAFLFLLAPNSHSENPAEAKSESTVVTPLSNLAATNKVYTLAEIEAELVKAQEQIKISRDELFKSKHAVDDRKRALIAKDKMADQLYKEVMDLTQQLAEKQKELENQLGKDEEYTSRVKEAGEKQEALYQALEANQKLSKEKRRLGYIETMPADVDSEK